MIICISAYVCMYVSYFSHPSIHPFIHSFICSLSCGIIHESPLSESGTLPVSGDVTMSKTKFLLLWSSHVVAGAEGKRGKTDKCICQKKVLQRKAGWGGWGGPADLGRAEGLFSSPCQRRWHWAEPWRKRQVNAWCLERMTPKEVQHPQTVAGAGAAGFRKGKEIRGPGKPWARTDLVGVTRSGCI